MNDSTKTDTADTDNGYYVEALINGAWRPVDWYLREAEAKSHIEAMTAMGRAVHYRITEGVTKQ